MNVHFSISNSLGTKRRSHWHAGLVCSCLAFSSTSGAQPVEPPVAPDPSDPPADSEASELAEIEAALAEDSAPADATTTPPSATAPAAAGAGAALNPEIAVILDFAAAYFSDEESNLQTGAHDPVENGFNLQQLELALGAAVDPYFRFDANVVFSLFEVELEEAYGTTLGLPGGLQVRFGQLLTRFGRINSTHAHAWDFADQPFAIGRVFGAEGNRGLGVEASWLTPLPWYVELVGSATRADGEASARSFFGAENPGVDEVSDFEYVAALKQFFPLSDDFSMFWGLSGAFGPNPTGRDNRTEIYGTDLYLKYRPITRASSTVVTLQTEWLHRRRQVPEDVLTDVSGYAQLAWRFTKRWGTAFRYEYGSPEDADVAAARAFLLDPAWTEDRHRYSANLTFWPTEFSRLRLQGSADSPTRSEDPIYAVFLAAELVAGAHGSHEF